MIDADLIYRISKRAEEAINALPHNTYSRPAVTQVIENAIRDALMKAGHPQKPLSGGTIG